MKKTRVKKALVAFLTVALIAAFFLLLVYAADEEQGTETPSDVSSGGISATGFTGQEDENLGDFDVSGDESGSDVETYDGDTDDGDGELENAEDAAYDPIEGDSEDAMAVEIVEDGAPVVSWNEAGSQFGAAGAYLVFNVEKSDEQIMTAYSLVISAADEKGEQVGSLQKTFDDFGLFSVEIEIFTETEMPDCRMEPDTQYVCQFTATVDGESYTAIGTFKTAKAVSPENTIYLDYVPDPQNVQGLIIGDPDASMDYTIQLHAPVEEFGSADKLTITFETANVLIKDVKNGFAFNTITQIDDHTFAFSDRTDDSEITDLCVVTFGWTDDSAGGNSGLPEFSAFLVSYSVGENDIIDQIEPLYSGISIPVTVADEPQPPIDLLIGDVDGNGKVNDKDSTILARYLAKWDGYAERIVSMDAADIDRNGKVNDKDSTILARYLAKWDGYAKYFE